jgi:peptidoglycan glycosyltransferase
MNMDRQIRKLAIALSVCFGLLFVQLNYIQFFSAERLEDRPDNFREQQRTYSRPRGEIRAADGSVLAVSAEDRSSYKYRRLYPQGELFSAVTGYFGFVNGSTGVERTYTEELAGITPELRFANLSDLFVDRENVGNVHLSLHPDVQRVARDQLGDREGSVVALDPRTGAIDALWSFPTYDPNPLSANSNEASDVRALLLADPENPLRVRAYRDVFFPGSTFKVVTGSTGVQSGQVTETEPVYPVETSFDIDFTERDLRNFGGAPCGGTLFVILQRSCNTSFAQMGTDLGPLLMVDGSESFGFNDTPPIDLPDAVASQFPTEFPEDQGNGPLARASIGQGDVSSTPLQMALVTAGIANGGSIMTPHVMDHVTNEDGETVDTYEPSEWVRAISPETSEVMRRAMVSVVTEGTAEGLQIPNLEVGGKTGTAQLGTDPPKSHAWIIAFAGVPGQAPSVAVAVLVEGQDGASEQTGGTVAAPIAKAVIEAVMATRGQEGGG